MSSVQPMSDDQLGILKQRLAEAFVPHLPPLLDLSKPADHMAAKNISRAFSAYCVQKLLRVDAVTAAKSVVDDYEDNGIDAIHYHQASRKLFLVQGKLKSTEPFSKEEAQAFTAGVKDLVNQRYDRFNKNVQDRQGELEVALDEANEIILVAAHTAELISAHAKEVLDRFLTDAEKPDERLQAVWTDFSPADVLEELLAEQAVAPVNDELVLYGERKVETPRVTYYGQVSLEELVGLYTKHGNRLLEKNIRYFLGITSSDVNRAIRQTLESRPQDFFYLSNGVTAVAHTIEPRAGKDGGRRYKVTGLSVINGAQTVASSHDFAVSHPGVNISTARVLLTLILVDENDAFGADVTRARNHQNPVSPTHFAALDDIQERLRRELAFYKIVYRYRPEARDTTIGVDVMSIDEAAIALSLFHLDPSFPVTLKREPSKLLNLKSTEYGKIFNVDLMGKRLANAVRLYRRASQILSDNESGATGQEKLIYRHGRYAIMWLVLRANSKWLDRADVMSHADAGTLLSAPLDAWREKVRAEASTALAWSSKGPLAFFRNLTDARPFVVRLRDAGI